MREKEEILTQIWANLSKAPKHSRAMLEHEYCCIEVLIDIRDILVTDAKDAMNALIEIRKT